MSMKPVSQPVAMASTRAVKTAEADLILDRDFTHLDLVRRAGCLQGRERVCIVRPQHAYVRCRAPGREWHEIPRVQIA